MSTPAPPYPQAYLRKPSVGSPELIDGSIKPNDLSTQLVQRGGPISVATGSYTFAVTFPQAFPDTAYQLALEWLSGGTFEQAGACLTLSKTTNYAIVGAPGGARVTSDSTLNWRAWRLP